MAIAGPRSYGHSMEQANGKLLGHQNLIARLAAKGAGGYIACALTVSICMHQLLVIVALQLYFDLRPPTRAKLKGSEKMKQPEVDTEKFWHDGYLIVKNMFSPAEITRMREDVFASLSGREKNGEPVLDALADPHLQHWVHDERLISVAKKLLGADNLAYYGDGGYAVVGHGYTPGKDVGGWHRDNTDRSDVSAPDWESRYSLVRFGMYLQDHSRTSGGLIVRRDSHNRVLRGWKAHLHDRYLNTGIGEVGVWSMRIQHAGLGRCIRGFPGLPLGPYLQKKLPEFMQAPFPKLERTGFWISYGLDDAHLSRHCDYLMGRSERLEMWTHARYSQEILDHCTAAGLKVIDMPARMRQAIAAGDTPGKHKHHYQMPF